MNIKCCTLAGSRKSKPGLKFNFSDIPEPWHECIHRRQQPRQAQVKFTRLRVGFCLRCFYYLMVPDDLGGNFIELG
jgi:hypothetical protein